MKSNNYRTVIFDRIEFWAATALFVFAVFFHITHALGNGWMQLKENVAVKGPINYYFLSNLIEYVVLYSAFTFLNFVIVPRLIRREAVAYNIFFIVLIYLVASTIFGATDTYLKDRLLPDQAAQQSKYNFVFQKSFLYGAWLLLVYGFYCIVRYTGLYLLSQAGAIYSKYKFITPGSIVAFVLWMLMLFLLLALGAPKEVGAAWAIVILFAILYFNFSYTFLLPQSKSKRPFLSYLGMTIGLLLISYFPIFLLGLLFAQDEDAGAIISAFNAFFQLLITLPLSWVLYRQFLKRNSEITSLKQELGQSHASFDFLRSQINPHFLFNALNTIYGTALQEGAERTGEGIERLSGMMRFMLQENMQKTISLSREIDYLNNYISLQKLRTDPNPLVRIQTGIEEPSGNIEIAPMLLVPFVENAFKHGISFREPSYITVHLDVRDSTLYFDVSNSKHARPENDPEKDRSGIGLLNVQQRLQLLYPGKHELVIRETKTDFFVHLTLQLS